LRKLSKFSRGFYNYKGASEKSSFCHPRTESLPRRTGKFSINSYGDPEFSSKKQIPKKILLVVSEIP